MQVKVKSTKATWSSACVGGECGKFMSAKKHSSDYKDLNTLIDSTMEPPPKIKSKGKPKDYSDLGDKSKYINFKKLDISMESNLE